jgi:uroporphyrinogen III methyltransferase/synthase
MRPSRTPSAAIRPLAGRRVVVTRARDQAGDVVRRLADLGAEVVELPVIAIEDPVDDGAGLAAAADRVVAGRYSWVVVTSVNAVSRLLAVVGDRALPGSVRWAAVGRSTAGALAARDVVPDLVPETASSEALVEVFPRPGTAAAPDDGGTAAALLYVRAETTRDVLVPGLAAKGWRVDEVVGYRTVAGQVDAAAVDAVAAAEAVAFTSPSTVEHTVALVGAAGIPPVIATIGPVTSESVREAGLQVAAEATDHTAGGLVDALVAALTRGAIPAHDSPARVPPPGA